jgi:hypothetical protein
MIESKRRSSLWAFLTRLAHWSDNLARGRDCCGCANGCLATVIRASWQRGPRGRLSGRLVGGIGCFTALCVSSAFACSCVNSTPLQKDLYTDSAVFTARIIHLMGSPYKQNGRLVSTMALAVVRRRYWGLPSYWPGMVVLDGRSMCFETMSRGEYLVQGRPIRFGVLDVSHCTRTRPIEHAKVDFRTLDGSLCAGPGGTIIGRVLRVGPDQDTLASVAGIVLIFRNSRGETYPVKSDKEGFYEVRHLAPGFYSLDSPSTTGHNLVGGAFVRSSGCVESTVWLDDHAVRKPGFFDKSVPPTRR